jgi:hypothetical protein
MPEMKAEMKSETAKINNEIHAHIASIGKTELGTNNPG